MTELDKFSKNGAVSYSNAAKERETLNVENAADRIRAIIRAEHARTRRSIYKYYELLGDEQDEQQ